MANRNERDLIQHLQMLLLRKLESELRAAESLEEKATVEVETAKLVQRLTTVHAKRNGVT